MRIWIGNLAWGTTEEELRQWLYDGGFLAKNVRIITHQETGQSRGFGFAEIEDPEVITSMNGQQLQGRRTIVREADKQQPSEKTQPGRQRGSWKRTQDNRHGEQD